MWRYYTLLTDLRLSEIKALLMQVVDGALHPMQAKKNLAHAITKDFHSTEAADAAAENWATLFQKKSVSEDLPIVELPLAELIDFATGDVRTAKLLHLAGLAASASEATRKLAENAVSLNGEKFSAKVIDNLEPGDTLTLRLGKKSIRILLL